MIFTKQRHSWWNQFLLPLILVITCTSITAPLNAGSNHIQFCNDRAYAPDLDRIDVSPTSGDNILNLTSGAVSVEYDLNSGTANFYWNGVKKIADFYSAVWLSDNYITSKDYTCRTYAANGAETIITHTGKDNPTMKQHFILSSTSYFLVQVEMEGSGLSSNWMGAVIMDTPGGVDIGRYGDVRALQVPFDNDNFVRYNAMGINNASTSYEVSAFYDNISRQGLVVGSVTHDTWKTGITFSGSSNKLDRLEVYGGVADTNTHDVMAHGAITGDDLFSPTILVGFYTDWRRGLEEFADVNAAQVPKLDWSGGVPFGWNSWGRIKRRISYSIAMAVSDFFKNNLQNNNFHNRGTVYINLDSFWDNLSDAQLQSFTAHVHANGQKAGIYFAPFAHFGSLSSTVRGSTYRYSDIVLRQSDGSTISLDGGLALDPTHPGTLQRIDWYIDKFKHLGFDYVKLDFLSHGAIEGGSNNGLHYDSTIQTGIQAYNQGMQYVMNRIGATMFISESIAPLFPYQYAHARRVSCDTFGSINETEYEMNSASYGWWMSGRTYSFNDPDHMVLEGHSAHENKSRVTSGVVTGTVFLNGDDVTQSTGQRLTRTWLTNNNINSVARIGMSFQPVEGNTGNRATDVFMLQNGTTVYLAVFNYNGSRGITKTINLARAGLSGLAIYTVTDLWDGNTWTARGTVTITLGPGESTILSLQ